MRDSILTKAFRRAAIATCCALGFVAPRQPAYADILIYHYSGNTLYCVPPDCEGKPEGILSGYVAFDSTSLNYPLWESWTSPLLGGTLDCFFGPSCMRENARPWVFHGTKPVEWEEDALFISGSNDNYYAATFNDPDDRGSVFDVVEPTPEDHWAKNTNDPGTMTLVSEVPIQNNVPYAHNLVVQTQLNTPIQIDLTAGSYGDVTSANLVSTPVGGTVTGFPSTTVQFTPASGIYGPGTFLFDLANADGTSNPATVTISIPAESKISPSAKALAAQLAQSFDQASLALGTAADVADSVTSKNPIATFAKEAGLDVAVWALAKFASTYDELYGSSVELSYGFNKLTRDILKRAWKSNPIAFALEIDSLTFTVATTISNAIAHDPPNFNYEEVAPPSKLRMPSTGNPVADQVTQDYLEYTSLEAATLHAAERWQGAHISGAKQYEREQLDAFNKYSALAKAARKRLQKDNRALRDAFSPVDVDSFPGGAQKIAKIFRSQCGKPLPKRFNDYLLSLGVPQDSIDGLVCEAVSGIGKHTVTTDFRRALSVPLP